MSRGALTDNLDFSFTRADSAPGERERETRNFRRQSARFTGIRAARSVYGREGGGEVRIARNVVDGH